MTHLQVIVKFLERQNLNKKVPFGFGKPVFYDGFIIFENVENITFGEMLENTKFALNKTITPTKDPRYVSIKDLNCYIGATDGSYIFDRIGTTILKYWEITAY